MQSVDCPDQLTPEGGVVVGTSRPESILQCRRTLSGTPASPLDIQEDVSPSAHAGGKPIVPGRPCRSILSSLASGLP